MAENEVRIKIKPIMDISDIQSNVDQIRKVLGNLKINSNLGTKFREIFSDLERSIERTEKQVNSGIFDQKGLNNFNSGINDIISSFNQLYANIRRISAEEWSTGFVPDPTLIEKFTADLNAAKAALESFGATVAQKGSELNSLQEAFKALVPPKTTAHGWNEILTGINTGEFKNLEASLASIRRSLKDSTGASEKYKQVVAIIEQVQAKYKEYADAVAAASSALEAARQPSEQYNQSVQRAKDEFRSLPEYVLKYKSSIEDIAKSAISTGRSVDQLISRFEYFFSITNAFRLLSRTIRSAFSTVKELDTAMTETATVTEYSVGQMWDKLDEYTAIANELGATTLGTYKTITLFFQQGLDEQQSLALATETMKMARVAGIDYAEATQYMTSALRGFNMELNETSATRVNDVYSELAKITAADTEQIAVAMSKVASLANSANMELETTSAILSQIIETTQEAPETAGTALKTIIARFAEVKKLYTQGELTGQDEEGEEIDVNKVSVALRKAGINLNEFILGNKGLDEIFLELSKKWDTLDLVTQRYIATMAAGSRQQSRFIAMMQDYDRLLELTNAAYNSAGSGQEQFEKTLESMEAKLNKLKNAWDSFTMSITNSSGLKIAVDTLTSLLTVINKVTDAFGKASGVIKVALGVTLAKAAIKFADPIFTAMKNASGQGLSAALKAGRGAIGTGLSGAGSFFTSLFNPKGVLEAQIAEKQAQLDPLLNKRGGAKPNKADEVKRLKSEIDSLRTESEKYTENVIANTNALLGWGAALSAAGNGIKWIGTQLKETRPELGKLIEILGSSVSVTGNFMMAIGALGRMNAQIGNWIGGLSAIELTGYISAIFLIVEAFQLVAKAIQKVNEGNKALADSLSTTAKKISDIDTSINSLSSAKKQLEELKKGSADWYAQLAKINEEYDELVKKYPDIANFIRLTDTGFEIFDEKGLTEFFEKLNQQREKYANANLIGDNVITGGSFWKSFGVQVGAIIDQNITPEESQQILDAKNGTINFEQLRKNLAGTKFGALNLDLYQNQILDAFTNTSAELNELSKEEIIDKFTEKGITLTDQEREGSAKKLKERYLQIIIGELLEDAYNTEVDAGNIPNAYRDRTGQNKYNAFEGEERTEQLDATLANNEEAAAWQVYYERIDQYVAELGKATDASKAFSIEIADLIEDYKSLTKVLSDNEDVLKKGEKDSQAYLLTISKITVAARKIYGESLDSGFVEEYADKFYEAFVEGSESAAQEINNALIKNLDIQSVLDSIENKPENFMDWDVQNEEMAKFRAAIDDLVNHDWTMEPIVDWSTYFQALNEMAGWTEKEFEAIAKAIGLEGVFTVDEATGKILFHLTNPGSSYSGNVKPSGKGGGSKKKNAWENPYDQLYNLTERNEEAIRRRNILEKEYNAILRDRLGSSSQLLKNSLQELANLQEQLAYQRRLQEGRIAQLNAVEGEMYTNSEGKRKSYADWGVTQYAHYNQQTNAIEIDWDAIDQVTDEEKGKAIEDYIKRLEELQKLYEQTQSDILDIEAAIDEINERGKKDYLTFEQRIYDAIVKQYQDQIDAYASLSDQIDEANQEILDQLNEQIELERQIRDNTKKEEEIADKEARLAYLQRDTSGANQTEILALQKEIEEARQSYQDDLIDQQIEQIQKGNEAASEQRQKQIELMQAQLDYWTEIGAFWSRVSELIDEGINDDGTLKNNSELVQLLEQTEGFIGMSEFGKMNWMNELVKTFMQSMEGFGKWMMEQAENEGTITQNGLTYTYDKDKKAWMLGDEAYSAVYDPVTGQYIFTRNPTNDVTTGTIGEPGSGSSGGGGGNPNPKPKPKPEPEPEPPTYTRRFRLEDWEATYTTTDSNITDKLWKKAYTDFCNDLYGRSMGRLVEEKYSTIDKFKEKVRVHGGSGRAFKTGGFADYTGLAWLDGSRTKPEAVLNPEQTRLFVSLRDTLERLKQHGKFLNELHGDTYVDLDVNANIGSDYDVDSLVTRLKRDILESSNYRNANVLSRGY